MRQPPSFKDTINDVAFDYYGRRLATCSTDHTVKIFDRVSNSEDLSEEAPGEWRLSYSWRAHTGSVWRICWAHPEFGQVLATCSLDRQVAIWEEVAYDETDKTVAAACHLPNESANHRRVFRRRSSIVDSRSSVADVQFAPKHIGLMLAMASHDGTMRIYEAVNPFNLSEWTLRAEVLTGAHTILNCVSWSNNRLHNPIVAVGADESIYMSIRNNHRSTNKSKLYMFEGFLDSDNKDWKALNDSTFNLIEDGQSPHQKYPIESVKDLEFAPSNGRSYHLLAAAVQMESFQKSAVLLYKIKPTFRKDHHGSSSSDQERRYNTYIIGQYSTIQIPTTLSPGTSNKIVWRVKWNFLGSVFASICTDGEVIFTKYRPNIKTDFWEELGRIKHDGSVTESGDQSEINIITILPEIDIAMNQTLMDDN